MKTRCCFLVILCICSYLDLSKSQGRDCVLPADLFFVIDGSDSLTDANFNASKKFVIDVLSEFRVMRNEVHVGANVFGTDVYDRVQLHGPTIYPLFLKRISTMNRAPYSNTATFKAIKEMREEFELRGRENVTKVGVVITDGKSINSNLTYQESILTRDAGINMIAIGVGSNIFRPELENIAGDVSKVFVTGNIDGIVGTIQNAIKDLTCTRLQSTTQAASTPTTTGPLQTTTVVLAPDFDCPDCMINKDHGYQPNDRYCQKYYEIVGDGQGQLRKIARKCRDGLFWDQYHLTCKRPEQVNCPNDPCINRAVASYAIEGMCSGYVACVGGRSFWACCGVIQRYVPGTGCVTDPTCTDGCDSSSETNLQEQEECRNFPHATNPNMYIEMVPYHGNFTRRCAPGTTFDAPRCVCVHDRAPPSGKLDDCSPAANLTFDTNFMDSSGHFHAGSEFVKVQTGQAVFYGNGMLNIYRFSGDDFGTSLVMQFRFYDLATGSAPQALVTNCIYSSELSASISIITSGGNVVFSTDTEMQTETVSVPYNPTAWNDVTYIYDGDNLTGVVNGNKAQKPLMGRILIRRSGIILGAGSQMTYFTGTFDELYKCFPGFADAYRVKS